MQNIRRATKKHRKLLIVVVALLCIGVVGFFGAGNNSNTKGNGDPSLEEQITSYEKYIAENEPASVEEADFAKASSMASLYSEYASLLSEAYSAAQEVAYIAEVDENGEAVVDEDGNPVYSVADQNAVTQMVAYQSKYSVAMSQVVAYYQQAIDQAPEVLNELARGQLYANLASAKMYTGVDMEEVGADFEQALKYAPLDGDISLKYANYLIYNEGFQAASDYLYGVLEKLTEEDSAYATIQTYAYMYSLYAGSADDGDATGVEVGDETPEDAGAAE